MPIVSMNAEFIKNQLRCPNGKARIEYVPDDLPGMYVLVTATTPNIGTYFYRYKNERGITQHVKVGRTTEISLAEARKQVIKLKSATSSGADPRGEAKALKALPTLSEFFDEKYLEYVKPRKRSWRRDVELFRLHIEPEFGHLKLHQIVRRNVQVFHANLVQHKGLSPASSDHAVKCLRHIYSLAVEWEVMERNPLQGFKLFSVDNQINNSLNDAQRQRLLDVLKTDSNRTVCQIAMFLLSTGCRLNEALQATWDQVHEEARMWRIPARNSKSKRMRAVPLNDSALYVLQQLTTKGEFDHLFINRQTKKPYTTIMKVWSRLRDKAGLPHFRVHDLRHECASLMVNDGRSLFEVQQVLGHADPRITQRYAHLSTKRLQEAANSASVIVRAGDKQ